MQFYKHARQIDRVYWLVDNNYTCEQILKAKQSVTFHLILRVTRSKEILTFLR